MPPAKRSRTKQPGDGDSRWTNRFTWSEELHKDFVRAIFGWSIDNMKLEQAENLVARGSDLDGVAIARRDLQKVSIFYIEMK